MLQELRFELRICRMLDKSGLDDLVLATPVLGLLAKLDIYPGQSP